MSLRKTILVLAGAVCVGGCGRGSQPPGARGERVVVVGEARHDFGTVRRSLGPLEHAFVLENRGDSSVSVADFRTTCSCTSIEIEPLVMPPGGSCRVSAALDPSLVVGKRTAQILVRFREPEGGSIALSLRAFIEDEYRVRIDPVYWAVGPEAGGGSALVRRFRVTELFGREVEADAVTEVESQNDWVRVEKVGPWRVKGWRAPGFAREGEIVLELRMPRDGGVADTAVVLAFEHRGEAGPECGARVELSRLQLMIRRL